MGIKQQALSKMAKLNVKFTERNECIDAPDGYIFKSSRVHYLSVMETERGAIDWEDIYLELKDGLIACEGNCECKGWTE